MDLARLAAARARTELAEPEAQTQAAEPAATQPADADTETALAATLRKAIKLYTRPPTGEPPPREPPAGKPLSAAQIFIRLTASVRACITLEARLAGGAPQTARGRPADSRRARLQEGFRLVTKNHPDRIDLLRATTARLDEELAADPNQTADVPELLFAIADELGIDIDLATLPDEFLGFTPKAHHKVEDDDAPAPRATSPP